MYQWVHGSGKSQHFRAVNQDTDLVLIQKEMRSKRFKVVYVVQREKKKNEVLHTYTPIHLPLHQSATLPLGAAMYVLIEYSSYLIILVLALKLIILLHITFMSITFLKVKAIHTILRVVQKHTYWISCCF